MTSFEAATRILRLCVAVVKEHSTVMSASDDQRVAEILICACRAMHLMAEIGSETTCLTTSQAPPKRRYLNTTEAAEYCGVSRGKIAYAVKLGRLKVARAKVEGQGDEFLIQDVQKFKDEFC